MFVNLSRSYFSNQLCFFKFQTLKPLLWSRLGGMGRPAKKNPGLLAGILYVEFSCSDYFNFNKSIPGFILK